MTDRQRFEFFPWRTTRPELPVIPPKALTNMCIDYLELHPPTYIAEHRHTSVDLAWGGFILHGMTAKGSEQATGNSRLGQGVDTLVQRARQVRSAAELAQLLRALRRRHARRRHDSELTYRELATRTGWSHAAVAQYLTGRTLPPTDRLDALISLLGASSVEQGAIATARDRVEELRRNGRKANTVPAGGGTAWIVPRQLPTAPRHLIGRTAELAALSALADQPLEAGTVVISAVAGMAGVGKTALAVHAGHRLAAHYPDGQLFIDLHGFTTGMAPIEPVDALDRLLRDLGVSGDRIPAGLDERAALWRSVTAERRILIVLDNAATEGQVQPLLPGAAGCLVLVTSRRHMAALEFTHTISLNPLAHIDAVMLFARTAGRPDLITNPSRHESELAEVASTVELCGRLPLAIRIAAARLRNRPVWTVADLMRRLRGLEARLDALDDRQRSVHTALHLSYGQLSAQAQGLYRMLGLHPGPEVDSYAAAALTDCGLDEVQRLLDELVDDHLLQESAAGRYVFHDLVRAHAADTAAHEEPQARQAVALVRLLDYYRHTAARAVDVKYPYERHRRPTVPRADTPTPELPHRHHAGNWLDTELPNLLATAAHGHPEHTWHLSAILQRHLRTRGRCQEAETLHQHALNLAREHRNRVAEMVALNSLGEIERTMGRYEQASEHLNNALQIAQETADRRSEVDALYGLGDVNWRLGRRDQANEHFERALQVAQDTGDRLGELHALTGLGQVKRTAGCFDQAKDHFEKALHIARDTGNLLGEQYALTSLGHVHAMLGRYEVAKDLYQRAVHIAQSTDDRRGELHALSGLGHAHLLLGQYDPATDLYQRAVYIAQNTGDRGGELNALNGLGDILRMLECYEQAADHYRQVLLLAKELDYRNWQYEALQGLGRLHHLAGQPDLALNHHQRALRLATEIAQAPDQARAHDGLAHAHHGLGQHEQARLHWQRAIDILTELGTDYTDDIQVNVPSMRAHLARSDPDPPPP